jgi:hypothetical protein
LSIQAGHLTSPPSVPKYHSPAIPPYARRQNDTGLIVDIETPGTAFASAIKLFKPSTALFTNHSMIHIAPFRTLFATPAIHQIILLNADDIASRDDDMNCDIILIAFVNMF